MQSPVPNNTHNTHKRERERDIHVPAGVEPAILAKRQQAHGLDSAATWIGDCILGSYVYGCLIMMFKVYKQVQDYATAYSLTHWGWGF